jgi:hypothetical protein
MAVVVFSWLIFPALSSLDSNDMVVGAVTTLDVKLFHISTVLCVNEYFLMSSLECDLYNLY